MQVHKLYNHETINNYIMPGLGTPLSGDGVSGIKTFLKGAEDSTSVELTKADLSWIEKFADPVQTAPLPERIENTTVQLLHPKSGITEKLRAHGLLLSLAQKEQSKRVSSMRSSSPNMLAESLDSTRETR